MPPRPPPRRGGVALGVLGIMLMAFFSFVFMLGRHSHWHPSIHLDLDKLTHPFDLHLYTDGKGAVSGSDSHSHRDLISGKHRGGDMIKEPDVQQGKVESKAVVPSPTPSPSSTQPSATAAPKPSPSPTEAPKAIATTAPVAVKSDKEVDGGITDLDRDYTPTKEMVSKISQDGYLMVTWANWHYWDFVQSWVTQVQSVGVTGYIVGAMDDHLLRELISHKYNCFSMKSGLTLGDFGWGSKTFAKMGREKIRLISIFLKLGVDVVISDVDVLWLRNPLPYFKRYPTADVLTSSDGMSNTVPDESLERWPEAGAAANIGIMLFRNKSIAFVDKWIEIIERDQNVWDQNAFNDLFRQGNRPIPEDKQNLFLGYNGELRMGILPVSIFCSGHTMYVQRMGQRLGLGVYAVHATFQFSGTPGKRHRMREFSLWHDPPEYYNHPNGFITFTMDGIDALLPGAGPNTGKMDLANVQGHFKLVNHQITRLRNAFALAAILKRPVIIPQLWCGQDRWWAPHAGRIPGSNFELPFRCPLDHVLDLENGVFGKHMNEQQFGPNTEIREFSFLNNSRTPDAVKKDVVMVEVCARGTAGCSDGTTPAEPTAGSGAGAVSADGQQQLVVRIQAGLKSAQLESALSKVLGHKVLHFSSMTDWGGFSDATAQYKFNERMKQYGSIWCCVQAHPGHIHYNMLHDQPHVDKFGRKWNGTWQALTGP